MFEVILKLLLEAVKDTQMTEAEYRYIASFLENKNVLVFGTGHDSNLWRHSVKNGKILFLEHNIEWITDSKDICQIKYTTHKGKDAYRLLEDYTRGIVKELELNLPQIVYNTRWDVILVDSPEGGKKRHPGRMQSIYAANQLASLGTHVFIHDCDREVEDLYSKTMFKKLIKELTKLRHYQV